MKWSLGKLIISASTVLLVAGLAYAGPISGSITSTLIITQNSWLTGNVSCNVPGKPCIQFGASDISLELNGHTITGPGTRGSCSGVIAGEEGIDTNFENSVEIVGPGLIGEFLERGIVISGNNSVVEDVVVSNTCSDGIDVLGSNNDIEHSKVVRASLDGEFAASIFVAGSGGHTISHNKIAGSGPLASAPGIGGHGIFIGGSGSSTTNNLIEGNFIGGCSGNGLLVLDTSGNQIIGNSLFGNLNFSKSNTAIQSSFDIDDENLPKANIYQDDACETSTGSGAPACPNLPEPQEHHFGGFGGNGPGGGDGHHDAKSHR